MYKSTIKKLWLSLCFVFTVAAVSLAVKTDAGAAAPPAGGVDNLKQTDASTSWTGSSEVTVSFRYSGVDEPKFLLQVRKDNSDWQNKDWDANPNGTTVSFPNAGDSYDVRIRPYTGGSSDPTYGRESAPIIVVTAPDGEPTVTQTSAGTNSISLKWSKVFGATGYYVTYWNEKNNSNTAKRIAVNGTNSTTISKLSKNGEYTVEVCAYRKSPSGFIAKASSEATEYRLPVKPSKLSKPSVDYYWKNLKEISLVSKSIACADGYQYEAYTAYQKKDKKVASKTTTDPTFCFLSKAQFGKYQAFKVRVRAYAVINGKKTWGAWSDWGYTAPQPTITKITNTSKGQRVSYDVIKGADRYIVYASTKQKSGYKKVATVKKKGSVTVTKFNKKKLKKNKTYYYYVEAQKKVGKKWVSLEAGNANDRWHKKYK